MKRRKVIFVLVWVAILLVVCIAVFVHSPEPSYQGKSVDGWIDEYAVVQQNGSSHVDRAQQIESAFKEMGSNSIPFVFRRLERQDAPAQTRYRDAWPKLPTLLHRWLPEPNPILPPFSAERLLAMAGTPELEFLIEKTKSSSSSVREVAAEEIHGHYGTTEIERRLILPLMTNLLTDPDSMVRLYAAGTLGKMGPAASNAVPALILALKDTDAGPTPSSKVFVRAWTATALGRMGPAASNAVPALTALFHDADPTVCWKAAFAVWQIDGDTETTLPVMMTNYPSSSEKWNLIRAFANMGPPAKEAFPMITNDLPKLNANDRMNVLQALHQVGLEAAGGSTNK